MPINAELQEASMLLSFSNGLAFESPLFREVSALMYLLDMLPEALFVHVCSCAAWLLAWIGFGRVYVFAV